jgi:acetyl-CoA acyltransferase
MKNIYLAYAKRSPIGRLGGGLAPVRPDDLMAHLLKDYKNQINFDPKEIDDVLVGCANQAGEDNRNIARMSLLLAGLPYEVPGATVNRLCGSSLDAVIGACGRIEIGLADCILVGGVESMSRAPLVINKASAPYGRDHQMYDSTFGWRFPNKKMKEMFPLYSMGETAENVIEELKISRKDQDLFAFNSHQKSLAAWSSGAFKEEVLPIEVKLRKKEYTVDKDEGPRADTSLEKLASLRAVFREGGSVTAGNASSMNDGAALVAVVSEDFLKRHKLTPLVRLSGFGIRGLHPNIMGLGPVEAVKTLCHKFQHKVEDFDVVELNEAFAGQSLGCIRQLGLDSEKVNLNGGAIALGHPLGCSGARILTTLTYLMKNNDQFSRGLATMCIGVGQGVALSVESC